jgi:hypothetical protein
MGTMTTACKMCGHEFGKWRPQCPACGTPYEQERSFNEVRIERRKAERKLEADDPIGRILERRQPKNQCIVCRQGGGKLKCPHCNECIHKGCLTLHADDCAAFQVTLRQTQAQHGIPAEAKEG